MSIKMIGAVLGLMLLYGAGGYISTASAQESAPQEHNGVLIADCEGVTATLTNFPTGEHDLTFYIDDVETDVGFTGPSGSVFLPWDFSAGGDHSIGLAWSADGGGQAPSITFNSDGCVPVTTLPPPTTEVPPPTTEVPPPSTTEPVPPLPPGLCIGPDGIVRNAPNPACHEVDVPEEGPPTQLARTGISNLWLVVIGVALILGGLYLTKRSK